MEQMEESKLSGQSVCIAITEVPIEQESRNEVTQQDRRNSNEIKQMEASSLSSINETTNSEERANGTIEIESIEKSGNETENAKSQNIAVGTDLRTEMAKEADNEVTNSVQEHEQQIKKNLEEKLQQLKKALEQKDNMISLYQRENAILEKEKQAFRKEKDMATKEKEDTVIKFAMKEKLLLDAKKEKDAVEKQLADAKKDIKNMSVRFKALLEEKSRMNYVIDEKCNEVRKYQRECEKLKTDYGHLESKLKYHMNKLNMEVEARAALERKLEEERNAPSKIEEKAHEQLKMEYEANTILLRHEITHKTEQIENLTREYKKSTELVQDLRQQLNSLKEEKTHIQHEFEALQREHEVAQNSLSAEMLNSAKLRCQLEELQLLRTKNALNEEEIRDSNITIKELKETVECNTHDLEASRAKELQLLSINKEVSESLVNLQNDLCLLKSKLQGIEAENEILKKERIQFDQKYEALEVRLQEQMDRREEEDLVFTKQLAEKTKLCEATKTKLDNVLGDFEATNIKHATVVKELQREIQKYKKLIAQTSSHSQVITNGGGGRERERFESQRNSAQRNSLDDHHHRTKVTFNEYDDELGGRMMSSSSRSFSSNSSPTTSFHPNNYSRRASESSDAESTLVSTSNSNHASTRALDTIKGPSKTHLVERILRLQQASAKQTEKIDFLENHTLSLVAELQKKSKVVQYYMLRDQAGALTSTRSDQHKSELTKYGNGVMSAIYGGIKADNNKSMTLELSLEINKKLQAVLEDTLLKNITLKENLDMLGIEVDNLTRKLRQLEAKG